jgi:hypothetical protein
MGWVGKRLWWEGSRVLESPLTAEEELVAAIFGPRSGPDPFAAVVRVPSGEFPDCCLVCTFGRRYYGRIQCGCGPSRVEYREINDVCGHFERGVYEF